ncbi:nucleobase:cation symporter-1 [Vigna unguiculata]|uniref:Nucleobase:cation symporter-1 n=1 Tax=Vigna unguiculata TaxID=3917 RepID=A0A4D6MMF8_VIGUN|nr:nucleobase:cation symporter-1 [Vigna unguiculata]
MIQEHGARNKEQQGGGSSWEPRAAGNEEHEAMMKEVLGGRSMESMESKESKQPATRSEEQPKDIGTEAYQLLEEMKAKGLQPTVVTYGYVFDGLAKIDRLDEAYMLFEEAKSKGVDLNVVVYSSLVDGFGKVGRIDEAYLILEELMQKDLTPNTYTWNCLLDALVKAEEIYESLVCFQNMKNLKCPSNEVTYSIMINGLRKRQKTSLRDLSQVGAYLIEGLSNANKAAIVGAVLREMAKSQHATRLS